MCLPFRTDYAHELAAAARHAFAINVARGEAGVRLAEAALQIAAEDDAIGGSLPHWSVTLVLCA